MQRGYIKLFRKSVDNPLFRKPLVWHYFEYCLLKANHKDNKMIWNKKEIVIERGSFITGRVQAAKETGLTERNIRTAISTLENLGMLFKNTEKSTSKFTYLTVCNYALYHDYENDNDQQVTSKRPASDQQVTTNKNVQTPISTNKKKDSKKSKKTISPVDDKQAFINQLPDSIIKVYEMNLVLSTLENLIDYCKAHNKKYTDYNAALRSFLKRDLKDSKSKFEKKPVPTSKEIIAGMEINSGEPEKQIWNMEPEIKLLNQG